MKRRLLAILTMGMICGPTAVQAAIVTYDWVGTCALNCTTATGVLTLDGYTPGTTVGVTLGGSEFSPAFVITVVGGTIPGIYTMDRWYSPQLALPAASGYPAANFRIYKEGTYEFPENSLGNWYIAGIGVSIWGTAGTFTLRTTSVPEPGTLALLGLGLAGLGFTRRRKAH